MILPAAMRIVIRLRIHRMRPLLLLLGTIILLRLLIGIMILIILLLLLIPITIVVISITLCYSPSSDYRITRAKATVIGMVCYQ